MLFHMAFFLATLHAYECDTNILKLMYSYMNDRKQSTKIDCARSDWKTLTKGLPQESVKGLFNIFMNDLFLILESLC